MMDLIGCTEKMFLILLPLSSKKKSAIWKTPIVFKQHNASSHASKYYSIGLADSEDLKDDWINELSPLLPLFDKELLGSFQTWLASPLLSTNLWDWITLWKGSKPCVCIVMKSILINLICRVIVHIELSPSFKCFKGGISVGEYDFFVLFLFLVCWNVQKLIVYNAAEKVTRCWHILVNSNIWSVRCPKATCGKNECLMHVCTERVTSLARQLLPASI